jgi:hypothetical protein
MRSSTTLTLSHEDTNYTIAISEHDADTTTICEKINDKSQIILTIPNKLLPSILEGLQQHIISHGIK